MLVVWDMLCWAGLRCRSLKCDSAIITIHTQHTQHTSIQHTTQKQAHVVKNKQLWIVWVRDMAISILLLKDERCMEAEILHGLA